MKKILIFGASGYGRRVFYSLDDRYLKVTAFIDNHKAKQGGQLLDIPIIAPEQIVNYEYDYIIISVGSLEASIKPQLIGLGVAEEKIVTYLSDYSDLFQLENRHVMARSCMNEIKARGIRGSVAEVGVYKGDFAAYLNRHLPDRKLYLFDTFEGFDARDEHQHDQFGVNLSMFKDTNVEIVLERMKSPENVIIKKGYFPETAAGLEDTFCFVSLDTDLYKPIFEGLEYFYPRLEHGGYIFIHDFDKVNWPGVTLAVREYCEKHKISYVPILDRGNSVVITK
ncbi:TylF/MycF/NovP-related O-methyltransferase [Paenibacillus typhae]|uniref:TylF/MycF/NovP-related O-methyltransferase n=1 Tax=Paenibacillus typhae TaxID=1174501 RepID=UPI001C8D8023|nr:TylF/MycF/NovP-related O-methyltransferase [Paenibacillus typhae]MBY0011653.1 class I SAM-dependent methyltransferase [Paenibacillus typhae]